MMNPDQLIVFENVSKFYGDVLGVNRVNLAIGPGVTSLVGPNGSGKTTLMNLMTGLIFPDSRRRIPNASSAWSATVRSSTRFRAASPGASSSTIRSACSD
jgi:ABC-type multidrug transport system ATPase subunit